MKTSNSPKKTPKPSQKKIKQAKKNAEMKEKKEIKKMQGFWKQFEKKTCQTKKTAAIVSQNVLSNTHLISACSSSDSKVAGLVIPSDQDVESSPGNTGTQLKSETSPSSKT